MLSRRRLLAERAAFHYGVAYGNGTFVVVGSYGTILTSP
jgi:hypothetical protein